MGLRNVRGRPIGGKAEEDAVSCMSKRTNLKDKNQLKFNSMLIQSTNHLSGSKSFIYP